MRSLGDNYVKDGDLLNIHAGLEMGAHVYTEFRRHRDVSNKVHIIGFLSQWKVYYDQMQKSEGFRGKPLDPTTLEKVRCGSG